jgi:hypothetical protein
MQPRLYYVKVTAPKERGARKHWRQRFYVLADHPMTARELVVEQEYRHYEPARLDALVFNVSEVKGPVLQLASVMVNHPED